MSWHKTIPQMTPFMETGVVHPARLTNRRAALARLLSGVPAVWLAACSTSNPKPASSPLTTEGQSRSLAEFKRALVLSFEDHASSKETSSVLAGRTERIAAIRDACVQLADRLAEKLRASSGFQEVTRSGSTDDTTLTIAGSLWRYVDSDGFTRLRTRNRAGNAQVEIRVQLRGGPQNAVMATLVRENTPAGISPAPRASESLEQATERVIEQLADAITDTVRGGGH